MLQRLATRCFGLAGTRAVGLMQRQFNIRLWFAATGLGILALIWAGSAYLFSEFMTRSLLERESEVSQEFLQSIVDVEGAVLFESDPLASVRERPLTEFSKHIAKTPGIMRANIYSTKRQIIWSTEAQMVGKFFTDNDELETALKGQRVTEINSIENHKTEYVALGQTGLFIEAYLPMRAERNSGPVVGVVELYKFPTELNKTITTGKQIIWLSGLGAALLAYFTLYWIVQRGARVIESQQRQLSDMQSVALVGELASAVAHSLRNPMAGIRSSAELWRSELPPWRTEIADDVIHEIDRMNEYVRDLLDYSRADAAKARQMDPMDAISVVLSRRDAALRRNNVNVEKRDERIDQAKVLVDPTLFEHALTSIVTNAIEAMPEGGTLTCAVSAGVEDKMLVIAIADTGAGIPPELVSHVTESYFTTKSKGLGLGLALARGVIERWGGSIQIASARNQGTTVSIALKKA